MAHIWWNFRRNDPSFIAFCRMLEQFTAEEDSVNMMFVRPFMAMIFCRYCGEFPNSYDCAECERTSYCCYEHWDADWHMHERDCIRARTPRPFKIARQG